MEKSDKMNQQVLSAISFGITSGTITALGMLVGLDSATSDRFVIVAGLVVMAVADGLADACGWHLAEESEMKGEKSKFSQKEIWLTTIFTFLSVCGFILTFTIPLLLFQQLGTGILVAVAWGMLLLVIFNFYIARMKKESPMKIILEHLLIAMLVIIVSYWIGDFLAKLVG